MENQQNNYPNQSNKNNFRIIVVLLIIAILALGYWLFTDKNKIELPEENGQNINTDGLNSNGNSSLNIENLPDK